MTDNDAGDNARRIFEARWQRYEDAVTDGRRRLIFEMLCRDCSKWLVRVYLPSGDPPELLLVVARPQTVHEHRFSQDAPFGDGTGQHVKEIVKATATPRRLPHRAQRPRLRNWSEVTDEIDQREIAVCCTSHEIGRAEIVEAIHKGMRKKTRRAR